MAAWYLLLIEAVHSMHFITESLGQSVSFSRKFHFFVKTVTDSVRLGVVYLNLVLSTARGVMFCVIYLQSAAHITKIHDLFISLFYFRFFLTDPRSAIFDARSCILHPPSWFFSKPRRLFFISTTEEISCSKVTNAFKQ